MNNLWGIIFYSAGCLAAFACLAFSICAELANANPPRHFTGPGYNPTPDLSWRDIPIAFACLVPIVLVCLLVNAL